MDTILNTLEHILGLDYSNGKFFLFWSGIAQILFPLVAGILGYFRLKAHAKRHMDGLHNHISQEFRKLKENEK